MASASAVDALVDAYFAAWDRGDGAALAGLFAADGGYRDPTTDGAVAGEALAAVVAERRALFPDLAFERVSQGGGDERRVVEWILRGTNQGPWAPGINATGRAIALPGVDVIDVAGGRIGQVRSYFDQKALVEQMGLMALVQPVTQGEARYGYAMRVPSGASRPPGVIALTWIQGRDMSERERIREHARQNVQDFAREPGFIGIITGFTELRGFTVTAWEDEAALTRALSAHHAVARQELRTTDFVGSVWTSVWASLRRNRLWLRCPACAALEDMSDDPRACSRCNAALPPRPHYW